MVKISKFSIMILDTILSLIGDYLQQVWLLNYDAIDSLKPIQKMMPDPDRHALR